MDYVLYRFRYRYGNRPPESSVVEVRDAGVARVNFDRAEELARAWCNERTSDAGSAYRFINVEPFVAVSDRPSIEVPPPAPKPAVRPISA